MNRLFSWLYTSKSKNELGFKEIIDQLKESLIEDERFIFHETTSNNYIWVGDDKGIIGDTNAHYEIIKRRKIVSVELHFESDQTKNIFSESIGLSLPKGVSWFNWRKSKSLKMEGVKLDSIDIVTKLTSDLIFLEENIGEKVRSILDKIKNPKNYWLYAPGENAKYWDTFYKEGIIGLGWNDLEIFLASQRNLKSFQNYKNLKIPKKEAKKMMRLLIGILFIVLK